MPGNFLPLVYLSDIIHYSVEHKIIFNVFVEFLSLPKRRGRPGFNHRAQTV